MGVDQVGEATHRCGEVFGSSEGLGIEGGEVVDVFGAPGAEQRLQQRVGEHVAVEGVDEGPQRVVTADELVQRHLVLRHRSSAAGHAAV